MYITMSENLTDRDRADLVNALRRLAETNRQAARDALSVGAARTGPTALFKALSLADLGTAGPTARSVALSLRRQAARYEALIDKIGYEMGALPPENPRPPEPGPRVPAAQGSVPTE